MKLTSLGLVLAGLFMVGCGHNKSFDNTDNAPVVRGTPAAGGGGSMGLTIGFTTAFHAQTSFSVAPGTTNVTFGTFMFSNDTGKEIAVKNTTLHFLVSWANMPYTTGMSGPIRARDHIDNCRLRGWPALRVFMGPSNPKDDGSVAMHDLLIMPTFSSTKYQMAVAMDVVCDFTTIPPSGAENEMRFAVDFFEPSDLGVVDITGVPVPVILEKKNGNPPTLAVGLR